MAEFTFATPNLQKLCEQQKDAVRQLGPDCAGRLRRRLADLKAAATVADLVAGRPHPLLGDRAGQFAVDLAKGVRLVFEPDMDPVPILDAGEIDWGHVTKVKILFVGDYHD